MDILQLAVVRPAHTQQLVVTRRGQLPALVTKRLPLCSTEVRALNLIQCSEVDVTYIIVSHQGRL